MHFPPVQNVWFLTGPTASGKSAVGIAVAKHIDAEIILQKTGSEGTCFIVSIAISTAAEELKKNISK